MSSFFLLNVHSLALKKKSTVFVLRTGGASVPGGGGGGGGDVGSIGQTKYTNTLLRINSGDARILSKQNQLPTSSSYSSKSSDLLLSKMTTTITTTTATTTTTTTTMAINKGIYLIKEQVHIYEFTMKLHTNTHIYIYIYTKMESVRYKTQ